MLPLRCAHISRPAACSTLKQPFKLTATTRSNSAVVYCSSGLRTLMPGVEMTMSSLPLSRAIASNAAETPAPSRTSTGAASAPGIRAATARAAPSFASSTMTWAPCFAAPMATASPMPDPPPMMAAVFPVKSKSPFWLIRPRARDEHDQKPNRSGDQSGQLRGQPGHFTTACQEAHADHRGDAARNRRQRLARSRARHVEPGDDRHKQRDAEQRVEDRQRTEDAAQADRQRHAGNA